MLYKAQKTELGLYTTILHSRIAKVGIHKSIELLKSKICIIAQMKKSLYYIAIAFLFYFIFGSIFFAGGRGMNGKGFISNFVKPLEIVFDSFINLITTDNTNGHIYPWKSKKYNQLREDIYILNTTKNFEDKALLEIINLKNSKVVYSLYLTGNLTDGLNSRQRYHAFFDTQFKKIIVMANYKGKMACYDMKTKKQDWCINSDTLEFHHRLNVSNNIILVNTRKYENVNKKDIRNEGFAEFDIKTGKLLHTWWLNDNIKDLGYLPKYQGTVLSKNDKNADSYGKTLDYWHLNDVKMVGNLENQDECILNTGDILLSSRNLNAIIHVRKYKVINTIQGVFHKQHDVDVINGNEISIFNNNTHDVEYPWKQSPQTNIIYHNLLTGKHRIAYENCGLNTATEGQFESINQFNYLENQNSHEILLFKNGKRVFQGPLESTFFKGKINLLNWCQIINPKHLN